MSDHTICIPTFEIKMNRNTSKGAIMPSSDDLLNQGQQQLKEVALRYANGHGLHPDRIAWDQQYDEWWLKVSTADHSVRVVFSRDEIEDFALEGEGSKGSKIKIRNAFASLAM